MGTVKVSGCHDALCAGFHPGAEEVIAPNSSLKLHFRELYVTEYERAFLTELLAESSKEHLSAVLSSL